MSYDDANLGREDDAVPQEELSGVAIIGMAGRFPGASSVAEFWRNQMAGVEAISHFRVEELEVADREAVARDPAYVRARSVVKDVDVFDAEFFGVLPKDAVLMDPQHRLFLECCWQAFEDAGYDPRGYPGAIGVVAGSSYGSYFHQQVCDRPGFTRNFLENYQIGNYPAMMGNHPDYLATRVAYKLDLKGPAFSVQTACSTSLLAVSQACQSLLTYGSDMMLAGGVSITLPQRRGYRYQEGGMGSADGHCRPFDRDAQGTVFGSGVGVVLLKRLEDALADGDQVYAVIRGSAMNNDGAGKVGFTAPSVDGQAQVITMAQQVAGVEPGSVGYIEAHGTATPLGDPIELAALERAFRTGTDGKGFCVIGTAKANVGHLDIAAGVTGLIHATQVLRHRQFPATLHFREATPHFDLASSPFRVLTEATAWPGNGTPRRAGVSSFGVGGTNVHLVLEEAPAAVSRVTRADEAQLLPISARSPAALQAGMANLLAFLEAPAEGETPAEGEAPAKGASLADAAWTLQAGRRSFEAREFVVARSRAEAAEALRGKLAKAAAPGKGQAAPTGGPRVCFLFPGQGSQAVGMGRALYATEPVFRAAMDRCAALLREREGLDLQRLLYPVQAGGAAGEAGVSAGERKPGAIDETEAAQPALFAVEYALAKLWESWGIRPDSMIGHSVGEFAAACLAGVLSLEDAVHLVAERGRLMQRTADGAMVSVRLSEAEVEPLLEAGLSMAAVNAPRLCVVSGERSAIERLEQRLVEKGAGYRRLRTSHAFHSLLMDPILEAFGEAVRGVRFGAPAIPYLSATTGEWMTAGEAARPEYWTRHLREAVRFGAAVSRVAEEQPGTVFLEVGPGAVLSTLTRQSLPSATAKVVSSLPADEAGERAAMLTALGELWTAGGTPDWKAVNREGRRVSLPTYPFERKRFWLADETARQDRRTEADATIVSVSMSVPEPAQATAAAAPMGLQQEEKGMVQSLAGAATPRRERLRTTLVSMFEELSGLDISGEDASATFLEVGFDSLFLTQASQELGQRFGVKVTFRELLGELGTLEALSGYLDERLPPEAEPSPAPAQPTSAGQDSVASVAASAPAAAAEAGVAGVAMAPAARGVSGWTMPAGEGVGGGGMDALMRDQLQVMQQVFAQQLAAMSGAGLMMPGMAPRVALPLASPAPIPAALAGPVGAAGPMGAAIPGSAASPGAAAAPVTQTVSARAGEAAGGMAQRLAGEKDAPVELKGYTAYRPVQKSASVETTEKQQAHIRALIERYTTRTATSKRKTEEGRRYLADPRAVAGFRVQWKEMVYPIVTERSSGSRVWDVDGNEYVDILNGFGPIMLGHRPPFVEEAVAAQLHRGFETGPQTGLAAQAAKALCEMTGNERAAFCNTGSEAVTAAIRLARTVTGRNRVVLFAGDYHGMFDEVLVKGLKRAGEPHSMPLAPGIPRESVANMTVLEYGAAESLAWIRAHAAELAAVLVEPVQSRHPALQPVEFLRELRTITEETDVCLIFDEVVTGFRAHPGGCQALFGIRADLATYGKVLGGGMPLGVVAGKARYMDALDGGAWQYGDESVPETGVTFFAGTFVRHPLAMAASVAVLKHLKEQGEGLQQRLTARTAAFVERLNGLFAAAGVPTRAETFSSFFYFSLPPDLRFGGLFYFSLRSKGVLLLENYPCFLTTEHSDADLELVFRAFAEAVAEMQAGDLLPGAATAGAATAGATMAAVADGAAVAEPLAAAAQPVVPTVRTSAPVTESQLEILLAARLSPEANCSFNESFTLRVDGELDEAALTDALSALVGRYEALRATFDFEAGRQNFRAAVPVVPERVDLSAGGAGAAEAKLQELIRADAHQPFDLEQGPLFRATLLRFGPTKHALVFTSHHVVFDGWSANVLLDELATVYNARKAGVAATLEPLMPFGQYAELQEAHFLGEEGGRTEAFWLETFKTLPPLLDLPLDHARPAFREFRGGTYKRMLGADELKGIKAAGAKQKCTLFATLLSGFIALLHRLSGQDDVVVGVPSAGQSLVENRVLVGHCVNFLPMRGRVTDDMTLAELLEQMRKTVFDAYDHQNYTFGRLVRKLAVPRTASRLPLIEVQFNLEKVGGGSRFDSLTTEVLPNPKSFVNFDLFLNAVESAEGLTFYVDYNSSLLDESTVARWMDCFAELLRGLPGDPGRRLWELPLLTEGEREKVAVEPNRTEAAYPRELCVHELFERRVAQSAADTVALQFGSEQLSAEQLNTRANQLARYLVKTGVQPGDVLGVYMERSVEMIVALLATWKAGAAYVPLDPTFPPERLKMVFEDLPKPTVLTQTRLRADLQPAGARAICVDEIQPELERMDGRDLGLAQAPSALAYVIYTSGSTGRPKGVEVTHGSVVNLLLSMASTPGITANDTLLAVTTLSFDIAELEIHLPLITGAKLVLASRAVASDGVQLLELLRASKATILQATPVTFRLLLLAGWNGDPAFTAWCGGEALPRELADSLLDRGIALWNMYGPTETTIWSAVSQVRRETGPVRVGPPIANTQFYVLDAHRQLVPEGVAGELYIGGDGVARGYFGRPDLTAARFVPDPFRTAPGARLYQTGDLVRRLKSGEFEFLGRADGQIKLRGFRIELGEIESVLAKEPSVGQCVVLLREDRPGDQRLVAYVVGSPGGVATPSELRAFLLKKIPDYMVPSAFLVLPSFPLTANGKINRKELPVPDWTPQDNQANYVAPTTREEIEMARICAEVLHVERVGMRDNLFELGADSLHVFQISARASQAGIEVRPRQILQYHTIAGALAEAAASGPAATSAPLVAVSRSKYRIVPKTPVRM